MVIYMQSTNRQSQAWLSELKLGYKLHKYRKHFPKWWLSEHCSQAAHIGLRMLHPETAVSQPNIQHWSYLWDPAASHENLMRWGHGIVNENQSKREHFLILNFPRKSCSRWRTNRYANKPWVQKSHWKLLWAQVWTKFPSQFCWWGRSSIGTDSI